jgi:2-methylisocitrate lyase-like PEP mutase family enzyme
MPDLGLVTMNDMLANAAMIASLDRTVPLIADADTGYGGPCMVGRTVKSYINAGIAGLHLEDQVLSKRCGHLQGKEIVDEAVFLTRIQAAVMARNEMMAAIGKQAGDIVLIAGTDALQSAGYDVAVSRLKKAVEVGADVAFLEGPTNLEQCANVCKDLAPTPVLLNMVPGGVTPNLAAEEARQAGFRLIIYPGLMLTAVLDSCTAAAAELKDTGTIKIDDAKAKTGPRSLFAVCGMKECVDFDMKAGGLAYSNVV